MIKIATDRVDLRKGIDYIGVSVTFIVHDGNGRALLQKRGPHARDEQGKWDVGGGAIEFGESIEEAVKREIREELKAKTLEIKFLTVFDVHRQLNGQPTHWVQIAYTVKVDPNEVQIAEPHKISEIGWFTSNDLPSPLHSQFHKDFDVAVKEGIIK